MAGDVRWADVLCRDCTEDLLVNSLSWGPRWRQLFAHHFACAACSGRVQDLLVRYGGEFDIKPHLDHLPRSDRRALMAVHEAGHVVTGLEYGYPLKHAWVDETRTDGVTGEVLWDFGDGFPIQGDEFGAVSLAGTEAEQRWYAAQGIELSTADWVDVHKAASGDLIGLDQQLGRMPAGALNKAAEVVAANWPRIQHLGTELARHGRMDPDSVRRALHATSAPTARGTRREASPAPAPPTCTPEPALTTTSGGTDMPGIDEVRGTLSRATEETEQAQHALAQAMERIESARAAVAQAAQSSSRDEIQQVLAQYGHVGDSLRELGGRMAASVDQVRTYAAQL